MKVTIIAAALIVSLSWLVRPNQCGTQFRYFNELKQEANKNCDLAKQYEEILSHRFPNSDDAEFDDYFKSKEYNDFASYMQACDTSTSDLEEAKDNLISCQNPA